jgi:hypothetical protein
MGDSEIQIAFTSLRKFNRDFETEFPGPGALVKKYYSEPEICCLGIIITIISPLCDQEDILWEGIE